MPDIVVLIFDILVLPERGSINSFCIFKVYLASSEKFVSLKPPDFIFSIILSKSILERVFSVSWQNVLLIRLDYLY